MAGRKSIRGSYPKRLGKPKGKGLMECQASGQLRHPSEMVHDHRQGMVAREFADITPRFGTRHPQDVKSLGELDDPKAIRDARPKDNNNYSKQDLGISDQEVELSIREGRPPRRGY